MTTPEDLRTMLQHLAEYCALIEQDLQDSAYPAAASSNAGARPIGPKGKPPCSIVDLDYIIEDVAPRIKGWCFNLQESAHIIGLPVNQPLNVWVAWLSRHRVTLLDQEWGEDAADELADLTTQLRDCIRSRTRSARTSANSPPPKRSPRLLAAHSPECDAGSTATRSSTGPSEA